VNVTELSMKLDSFISWSFKGNMSMKIGEFKLGLFIKLVALNDIHPRKLTLLNLEFYNSNYGLIIKSGLG